jgi:hypothetical protein
MEFLIGVLVGALVLYIWHWLGDEPDEHELVRVLQAKTVREQQHQARTKELLRAYNVAKEELGHAPTTDQIFLTRDQLRTQDELEKHGTP